MKETKKGSPIKIILKIIIGLVCAGILVLVVGIGSLAYMVTSINKEYKSNEVIQGEGEKKALIIYEPSRTNAGEDITQSIAKVLEEKGYTVTINYPSKDLDYNWEDYNVIALGSAVFMGQVSPVLKEYVEKQKVENKHIFLYPMGADGKSTVEVEEMTSWIDESNDVVGKKCVVKDTAEFDDFVKATIDSWE